MFFLAAGLMVLGLSFRYQPVCLSACFFVVLIVLSPTVALCVQVGDHVAYIADGHLASSKLYKEKVVQNAVKRLMEGLRIPVIEVRLCVCLSCLVIMDMVPQSCFTVSYGPLHIKTYL